MYIINGLTLCYSLCLIMSVDSFIDDTMGAACIPLPRRLIRDIF